MQVTPKDRKFGTYRVGDVFEFPDAAAKIFIQAGKLQSAEGLTNSRKYQTASVEAGSDAQASEVEISPRTGKPKRQYRRADLRAED